MRVSLRCSLASTSVIGMIVLSTACTVARNSSPQEAMLEEIYILRSIRERMALTADACAAARTGFEPYAADAQRAFSFWSIDSDPADGRVVDAKVARVAWLHACMGPTAQRERQNFHAEIELKGMKFRASGECVALMMDFPQTRLFPVRCQLVLSGLPQPYVGGLLTTNTMTSMAAFGEATDPPGYTQASIATIRLWKAGSSR